MSNCTLVAPALLTHLCDDAAIFPPGLKPLPQAIPDHLDHLRSEHAHYVGPLLLSMAAVGASASLVDKLAAASISLSVTVPDEAMFQEALELVDDLPAFRLVGVETPLGASSEPETAIASIADVVADRNIDVFIEIPRDGRRDATLAAVKRAGFHAKFRTGGIRAELYPSETELAESIVATIDQCLQFKATAGLHHAVRNTDPNTGFEQHGFLNILLAVAEVLKGGDVPDVREALAERDGAVIAGRLSGLDEKVVRQIRHHFRSFGTCSISEPVDEMKNLGLITL